MIKSMTGFGRGDAAEEGISITVEIRSVNNRYLDISSRLPQAIQDKELQFKEIIQDRIDRGKVNLNVRLDQSETGEPDVTFNKKLVRGYKNLLDDLKESAGIEEPVTLRNLLHFNDIFESKEKDESTVELIADLTKKATRAALDELIEMRIQEGEQLKSDLDGRISHIEKMMDHITDLSENRAEEAKERLQERLQNLISDDSLDPERLEMEVALLADKTDITEEVVRLRSHLKYFREAINNEKSVGRRLNFLSQEINREINTIGSKANNSEISHYVVQAKESLEQIREQVQNVE